MIQTALKLTGIAALLSLVACTAGAADDPAQWRVGGSLSYSDYQRDDNLVDNDGTGFEAFAQYRFNSWLGVEGAFYVSPDFDGDVDNNVAGGEIETSFTGVTANAIGYLPLPFEQVDFFLKAGYFNFFDADVKVDGVTTDSGNDDGLALGGGISVGATEHIGLRVEVDWYDVSGAELYTVDIGVEYRF